MIREATFGDLEAIVGMGKAFYDYARFNERGLKIDPGRFSGLVARLIGNDHAVFLVAGERPTGTICGVMAPWLLDPSQLILQELWWWVMPESHGQGIGTQLITAFERAGKDKGASQVIMVTLARDKEDKLMDVYRRMGYRHLEQHFMKEV